MTQYIAQTSTKSTALSTSLHSQRADLVGLYAIVAHEELRRHVQGRPRPLVQLAALRIGKRHMSSQRLPQ